jgi:hypothetical protein
LSSDDEDINFHPLYKRNPTIATISEAINKRLDKNPHLAYLVKQTFPNAVSRGKLKSRLSQGQLKEIIHLLDTTISNEA